ncbi:MAG: hypothetical protein J6112_06030, partial [Clostridia bacterium]|nr:hypothetical protein [Clostridia bacterium]
MKKLMKLVPAFIMLLVSAILVSTATFAWFSMNTQVTATAMQVKAVAEDGLLIHNELDADDAGHWLVQVNATYGSQVALAPTSSNDMSAWYHNKSNDPNNYAGVESYETLSSDTNWKRDTGSGKTGVWFIDTDTQGDKDESEKAYVLQNRFYIKSSGDAIALGSGNTYQALYINKVQVTGNTSSPNLDKALRVAVKIGSEVFIYAPFTGATL